MTKNVYQYFIIFNRVNVKTLEFSSDDVDFGGLSYPTETMDIILWSKDSLSIDFKDGSSIMIPLTSIALIKRIKKVN